VAIVYREDLHEYMDLTDKQTEKAFNEFCIEHRNSIEDEMENFLFDKNGKCYDEKEIRF